MHSSVVGHHMKGTIEAVAIKGKKSYTTVPKSASGCANDEHGSQGVLADQQVTVNIRITESHLMRKELPLEPTSSAHEYWRRVQLHGGLLSPFHAPAPVVDRQLIPATL